MHAKFEGENLKIERAASILVKWVSIMWSDLKTFCEAFVVEFYLKLKLILRYLTYICWKIDNFVIKSDIFRRFFICKNILKNYRVTITTTLDTSCSENIMVLSARRGFLHACIF
jgi:hypothetical protein